MVLTTGHRLEDLEIFASLLMLQCSIGFHTLVIQMAVSVEYLDVVPYKDMKFVASFSLFLHFHLWVLYFLTSFILFLIFQLSNYCSFEGVLYCKPHFDQLFKMTGSLDKSFECN